MPAQRSQLTVRALNPVLAGLEALGLNTKALLRDAELASDALADLDATLAVGAMARLWQAAVRATSDGAIGIRAALAAPVEAYDMHGYAMLSSPTLRDAFVRACRYQHLLNQASDLTFTEARGVGVLRHVLKTGVPVPRSPAEFLATSWVRLGRRTTASDWKPSRVVFAHAKPRDLRPYRTAFGIDPTFGGTATELRVPAVALGMSNPRADGALVALLDRYAAAILEHSPRVETAARVRAWLVETHGAGRPTAAAAAHALAMSMRTLNRRLTIEGTSFRDVLDQLRREQAERLLRSATHSIADVAFLLGYSEISAFYRAFRRWTGRAPAEARQRLHE